MGALQLYQADKIGNLADLLGENPSSILQYNKYNSVSVFAQ